MMMKNVFPLKEVGDYLNARFVCVKIDAEKGEGPELAKRYKVKAYPTFVAIDPDEEVLMTKEGGTFDGGEFIGSIDRLINPVGRSGVCLCGNENGTSVSKSSAGYVEER